MDPRGRAGGRRIGEQAWDGLSTVAVSVGGSVAVILAPGLLLPWLG